MDTQKEVEVTEFPLPWFTKPGWEFMDKLDWSEGQPVDGIRMWLAVHPNHPTAYWMKEVEGDQCSIRFFTDLDEPSELGVVWFDGLAAFASDPFDHDLMSYKDYATFVAVQGKWLKDDNYGNCHFMTAETPDGGHLTSCVSYDDNGKPALDDMRTDDDRQVYFGPTLRYTEYDPRPELDGLEWRHEAVAPDSMEWIPVANGKNGKVYVERTMWESGNWILHVIIDRYGVNDDHEMKILHKVFGI